MEPKRGLGRELLALLGSKDGSDHGTDSRQGVHAVADDTKRIDAAISRLAADPRASTELLSIGRSALEGLLEVNEGKRAIDFGSTHPTDAGDAISSTVGEFLRQDPDVFFDVAETHPKNSAIAWVLYGWPDPRAVVYLLDCLGADGWPVRWAAVRALGSQGDQTVVDRIGTLLQDPDDLVRGATVDALEALAGRDAASALSGFIQAPPSYARATEIKRAEEVLERLRHTGFLDPTASSDTIAERLVQDFQEWSQRDRRLHDAAARLSRQTRYVLDTDLVWRASGRPSATRAALFDPSHENWRAVFGGRSPWVSATLMQTDSDEAVIGLATQNSANSRAPEGTFGRIALALSYEPRTLEFR